jgi:hypothetical protein
MPQDRTGFVANQPVENPAGLLGVDLPVVDQAGLP